MTSWLRDKKNRGFVKNKVNKNNKQTRQCASREGIDESLYRVGSIIEHTTNTTDKMNHMRVVLQILVEINLHVVAIAREVIAGQVYKHHMLSILLRVVAQIFCCTSIGILVAS